MNPIEFEKIILQQLESKENMKKYLGRSFSKETQGVLNEFGDAIDTFVEIGMRGLLRYKNNNSITEITSPLPATFMHFLNTLDSIGVVARNGNTSGVKTLFRTLFEASLNLQYLAKESDQKGVIAYRVGHLKNELKKYKLYDNNTIPGREFIASLTEELGEEPGLENISYQKLTENIRKKLKENWMQPVVKEYEKCVKQNGLNINWYSLYGGPKNLKALAKELKVLSIYSFLYADLSKHQHASDSLTSLIYKENGIHLPGIRQLDGLQMTLALIVKIVHGTYQILSKKLKEEEHRTYMYLGDSILKEKMHFLEGEEIINSELHSI